MRNANRMSATDGARMGVALVAALLMLGLAGCAGAPGTGGGVPGSGGPSAGGPSAGGPSAGGPSSDGPGAGGSGARDITGNWQLVSGTDAKGTITPGAASVSFKVNGASSGGHGPCNSFGATTRGSTTGSIAIVIGIHTEIACIDPDLNATEARYFAALEAVTRAALNDGTLTLSGGNDTLVFTKATP